MNITQHEDEMINLHGIGTGEDWEVIEWESEYYHEKIALENQFWNPDGVTLSHWEHHIEPPETNVFIERPKPLPPKPVYLQLKPKPMFSAKEDFTPKIGDNPLRKLVYLLLTGQPPP